MTFQPVLPAVVLVALAAVTTVMRLLTLRPAVRRRRPGRDDHALLRWCIVTVTVLLLIVAAARPTLGAAQPMSATPADGGSNVNVFFVIDRSPDSRVEDFGDHKSRMSGMREDILALINRYPRARFGVISFASRATVDWPLSDDVWSLKPMIAGLAPYYPAPQEGVNAGAASGALRYNLLAAQGQYPGSKNVVFYFGVGAPGSPAPQSEFEVSSTALAGGAVFGYGSSGGAPIPQKIADGKVQYARNAQTGGDLYSAINEPALTEISGQLGVPYVHRAGGVGIEGAGVASPGAPSSVPGTTTASEPVELYWAFTLPAAALILVEMYLTIGWFRRSRSAPDVTP